MNGIVILNYNDSIRTCKLVSKLNDFNIFDIILVVDNKSNTENVNHLKENIISNVVVIYNSENSGYARGYNVGLRKLVDEFNVDIVFLMNPDVMCEKRIFEKCINKLVTDNSLGAVSTNYNEYDGKPGIPHWIFPSINSYFLSMIPIIRKKVNIIKAKEIDSDFDYVDVVRGSFIGFRAKNLKKVDYFDTKTFLYFEENCIFSKMKNIGLKVGYIQNEYYIHNHPNEKQKFNSRLILESHKSAYYYFTTYQNVSIIKKLGFKILYFISYLEMNLIKLIKG